MPHYKLVRGFDQIDVKDTLTNEGYSTWNGDRFSVWTRIHRQKGSTTIKDAKALFKAIERWKAEGFQVVSDSTTYNARRYFR